ncbi:MAG: 30S ribosome-binding factor RbfA, partial [Nitrospirota bacterium]
TVTAVQASDDLRHAKVYVSIFEDAKREETLKILASSARFVRGELARRVKIKFIPELIFKLDESIEYGAKIEKILGEIKSSKDSFEDNENSS